MYEIITTAYNSQDYIEEMLDCLPKDVLITLGIDHCHKTLSKVQGIRHKYPNLRVWYNDENVGTYITRNTLIKQSHETSIGLLFLDSDDLYSPQLFTLLDKLIGGFDIVQWGYQHLLPSGERKEGPKGDLAKGTIYYDKYFLTNHLGGFRDWRNSADTNLLHRARLVPGNKHGFSNKPLMLYRQHENSLTSTVNVLDRVQKRNITDKEDVNNLYVEPVITTGKWKYKPINK